MNRPEMVRKISKAERRHQDALRLASLKVAGAYQSRLQKLRRKELRRVLDLCRNLDDPAGMSAVLEAELSESGYLPGWWTGLWISVGVPEARATAAALREAKAAEEEDIWISTLRRYATERAGENILSVSGTWKDTLVGLLSDILTEDIGNTGVEKVAKELFRRYTGDIERWQCRRIAQTETMIGAADAGDIAAQELDVDFTKTWSVSGLGNSRETHMAMDGVTVERDGLFRLPDCMMRYPHDTRYNPPAGEIINCACSCIRRPAGVSSQVAPKIGGAEDQEEARISSIMGEMPSSLPEATRRAIAKNDLELEKKLGIKKGKPMDIEKADKQSANPKYGTAAQYGVNCATCAPTYVLRERGFNITAKGKSETRLNTLVAQNKSFDLWKNPDGSPAVPTRVGEWLKGKGYEKMTKTRYKAFLEESCKEQGTYVLTLSWNNRCGGGGHATILKRLADGTLVNIEPQVYSDRKGVKLDIVKELCDCVSYTRGFNKGVLRVDDKIFDTSWSSLFNAH